MKIKERIKELSAQQIELRNQRRTERLIGERTMPSWEAALQHSENRYNLRYLYAAYGVLREKPVEMYIPKKKSFSIPYLQKVIEKYREETVRTDPE